jgi:hypothetical protein
MIGRHHELVDCLEISMSQNDRSSSRTSWPFRNIHVSNGNVCFLFFVDYFFPQSPTRLSPDLIMSNTASDIRIGNCLPFASAWAHPAFFRGVRIFHLPIFSFWYRFCLFVFCILCPLFSMSLNCSFTTAPSDLSIVYLYHLQTGAHRYATSKRLYTAISLPNRCVIISYIPIGVFRHISSKSLYASKPHAIWITFLCHIQIIYVIMINQFDKQAFCVQNHIASW